MAVSQSLRPASRGLGGWLRARVLPANVLYLHLNLLVLLCSIPVHAAYTGNHPGVAIAGAIAWAVMLIPFTLSLFAACALGKKRWAGIALILFSIPVLAACAGTVSQDMYHKAVVSALPGLEELGSTMPMGSSARPITFGVLRVIRTQNKPGQFIVALSDETHLVCDKTVPIQRPLDYTESRYWATSRWRLQAND